MKKKIVFVGFSLLVFLFPTVAEPLQVLPYPELEKQIVPYVQLDLMLDAGMHLDETTRLQMASYSKELDIFYKELLYDRYRQKPGVTALINLFSGGVGSLIDGHYVSGAVLQVGMLSVYSYIGVSLLGSSDDKFATEFAVANSAAVVLGLAGVTLPFIESHFYNKKIKMSLNL